MVGRIDAFGLSDLGLIRERNEDQFMIADLKKSVVIHQTSLSYDDDTHLVGVSQAKIFLVADGVGGNDAGDRASRLAVQGVVQYLLNTMHWLFRLDNGGEDAFLDDLKGSLAFFSGKNSTGGNCGPIAFQHGHHHYHGLRRLAAGLSDSCRRQSCLSVSGWNDRPTDA